MILNSNPDQVNPTKEKSTLPEKPLQSWKEIAAYLERDERTARRWEKTAGLPVRRHHDGPRSTVYAYASELEAWRAARKPKSRQAQLRHWTVAVTIAAVSIALAGWFILYGPVFNPPNPFVEAADGITLRQVWSEPLADDMGDVSLDGRFLTFTDWKTGDLAIRDLDSEVNRRITDKGTWMESEEFAGFSSISPDGNRISYSWYVEEGVYELRLQDLSRNEVRVLHRCTDGKWARPIDWLPDGSRILVGFFEDFLLVRLALLTISDQSIQLIASSVWEGPETTVTLSPDGEQIVYDNPPERGSDHRDIFMIPIEGGSPAQLVHHPADDYRPTWAPDGRCILFASDRAGSTGLWMLPMREGRPSDEPKMVKGQIGPLQNVIGCTRTGDLYYSLSAGTEDIYFFEIDPESGGLISQPSKLAGRYVGANMGPVFSPDGEYVAYHFQRAPRIVNPGALTLVVHSLKTGKEREIPTHLIQYGPVRWFPEGESVLVPVRRGQNDPLIDFYQIHLETGQAELIRESEPKKFTSYHPDLSADGKTILFMEVDRDSPDSETPALVHFKKFDIASRQERVLHSLPPGKMAMSVQFSPDEGSIAWVERNPEPPYMALSVKPVEGGTTREILRLEPPKGLASTYGFTWAPDGKSLLVSRFTGEGRKSEVLWVPLEGGEPRALGIGMERIFFGDIHKNGRLVAFYAGQQKGRAKEIWALNGFMPEQ